MLEILFTPFLLFTQITDRVYWFYLLTSLTIAVFIFIVYKSHDNRNVSLLDYLIPIKILSHRSAINDYFYFYANVLFQGTFVVVFFSSLSVIVSELVLNELGNIAPSLRASLAGEKLFTSIVWTLLLAMMTDFAIFIGHYFQHKIPWLWEFHKVHHSAEVLTPITVYRMHPVDNILTYSIGGLFSGIALGFILFFSGGKFDFFNIAGANLLLIFFYFFGYNLRHTHVWLSYGAFFSKIFISPAQHQIHHSSSPEHYDKNMGFMFAFWDGMFGTLYIPKKKEKINFGLGEIENEKFSSFWSLYLMPFVNIARNFRLSMLLQPKRYLSVLVFVGFVFPSIYLNQKSTTVAVMPEHVFMEDMTWVEVDQAIKAGTDKVLIPTGGTEQNGPHLVLGKHNYIVKYTAGKIAEKLLNTLVAPVLTYVPEGNITQSEGHMRFPGTLSVSEEVFANTLEFAARSMRKHGFKVICLVGDSGGNQNMQKFVADKLQREWMGEDVRVFQVDDYYHRNEQLVFLQGNGFSMKQIGSHAGIRDSSELLAVRPQGVRNNLLIDYSSSVFTDVGADGDASKASIILGGFLLELKIKAAVSQIQQYLAD